MLFTTDLPMGDMGPGEAACMKPCLARLWEDTVTGEWPEKG